MGWGEVVGKVFDWIPGKKESYKNEIAKLKQQLSSIQRRTPYTTNDSIEYVRVSDKLRQVEDKYKNI